MSLNLKAARRLETTKLNMLGEQIALQTGKKLHALQLSATARGGAISGGTLTAESDIFFDAADRLIAEAVVLEKGIGVSRAPTNFARQSQRI